MSKIEYGLQLYSLRDISKDDLEGAIRGAAEMGYHYMEFAGFQGHSAEQVKAWLDQYGVEASGTHTGVALLTPDKIQETIAYHKTIGCKNLIVPWGDCSSKEKLDELVAALNYAQPILAEAGITLGYHNHSIEFIRADYGIVPEEYIAENTTVELEIDTFWAFNAGLDPVATVKKYADRVRVIHLKDGIPASKSEDGKPHGKSTGEGMAPVLAVREMALEMGILMVIESEGLDPTGLEETGRCIKFLRSLEK